MSLAFIEVKRFTLVQFTVKVVGKCLHTNCATSERLSTLKQIGLKGFEQVFLMFGGSTDSRCPF